MFSFIWKWSITGYRGKSGQAAVEWEHLCAACSSKRGRQSLGQCGAMALDLEMKNMENWDGDAPREHFFQATKLLLLWLWFFFLWLYDQFCMIIEYYTYPEVHRQLAEQNLERAVKMSSFAPRGDGQAAMNCLDTDRILPIKKAGTGR